MNQTPTPIRFPYLEPRHTSALGSTRPALSVPLPAAPQERWHFLRILWVIICDFWLPGSGEQMGLAGGACSPECCLHAATQVICGSEGHAWGVGCSHCRSCMWGICSGLRCVARETEIHTHSSVLSRPFFPGPADGSIGGWLLTPCPPAGGRTCTLPLQPGNGLLSDCVMEISPCCLGWILGRVTCG